MDQICQKQPASKLDDAGSQPTLGPAVPAMSTTWDTIIVGSSPLLLIEAIYLSRIGRKVLVLEDTSQLGGAWAHLENNTEFPYLDIGCHYFDISRQAYEFLQSGIGLNLVPFRPQPQFAFRNILFPYDYRQIIRVSRNLKGAVISGSLGTFLSNMLRDENFRLRIYPFTKTFQFPRGGSHELISRLTVLARDANVAIRKPMRVESIRFDPDTRWVYVGAGNRFFECREIVAGSQARVAGALRIASEAGDTQRCVYTHVNLVFRDRSTPRFSYVRFIRHPAIIRMTDITSQMRNWCGGMEDYRVICIGIHDAYDRTVDEKKKVDELVTLLKRQRFIDSSLRCESSYWSRYPAEFLSSETQNKLLGNFAPMIRLIPTTNFSLGLVNNLSRWKLAFASPGDLTDSKRLLIP